MPKLKNTHRNPDEVITGIKSSHVSALEYYAGDERLVVTFADNSQWAYLPVSQGLFDGFKSANSVGKYLHSFIKTNDSITATRI